MPERPETNARRWSREDTAKKMTAFAQASPQTPSQRQ